MYRVGVIGTGFIGAVHVEALKRIPQIEVVAVADQEEAKQKAQSLGVPNGFSDYRAMIDKMRLDAVHICTPNHLHFPIAKFALEHGLHVVCEKPFTTSILDAEKLVELARKNKLVNAVNFHNRFYPMMYELSEIIQAGDLGEVISVHGSYLQDWLLNDTDFNWRILSKYSGKTRVVADIGSHWLDLVQFVTGLRITEVLAEFTTVYPRRKNRKQGEIWEEIGVDTEDSASILFRFENGIVGSAVMTQMFAGKANEMSLCIAGTKQSAQWTSENLENLVIGSREKGNIVITKRPNQISPDGVAISSYPSGHMEGFSDAFKHSFTQIYETIHNPGLPRKFAAFSDGLQEMRLCDAIFESAHKRSWIKL